MADGQGRVDSAEKQVRADCVDGCAGREFGGGEDNQVLIDLAAMQKVLNAPGKIGSIEVSAITTPENDLARKAAAIDFEKISAVRAGFGCTTQRRCGRRQP